MLGNIDVNVIINDCASQNAHRNHFFMIMYVLCFIGDKSSNNPTSRENILPMIKDSTRVD